MKYIAPPKQPPPDDFNLAYFVHCLAYIEQEKWLWQQRVKRTMRIGATAIMCLAIAFLAGCNFTVQATPAELAAYEAMVATREASQPQLPTVTPGPDMSPDCAIKVNWNGVEWVYHMPGGQYYDRTLVEPDKGEKFVCTEQEAIDAGARKALR